jgi:hypothetical protein
MSGFLIRSKSQAGPEQLMTRLTSAGCTHAAAAVVHVEAGRLALIGGDATGRDRNPSQAHQPVDAIGDLRRHAMVVHVSPRPQMAQKPRPLGWRQGQPQLLRHWTQAIDDRVPALAVLSVWRSRDASGGSVVTRSVAGRMQWPPKPRPAARGAAAGARAATARRSDHDGRCRAATGRYLPW